MFSRSMDKSALRYLLLLFLLFTSHCLHASELKIGLLKHYTQGAIFSGEWAWALRGGGAEIKTLGYPDLATLSPDIPMLVIDNTPLDEHVAHHIEAWVHQGGLLIYAGANAAMHKITARGELQETRELLLSDMLGVSFIGHDPGLIGTYPDITVSSPLLSPLQTGDALRLGSIGVGHTVQVEATDAEILARSVRLSPGPDGMIHKLTTPTILLRKHGQGAVIFLTFSPGQISSCYPDLERNQEARDCTGASQAHALMRWLAANLLWEERRIQLPLLWEAPGDRPQAVIVSGDVHHNPFEVQASLKMGELLNKLELPLSLYIIGQIATDYPQEFIALQKLENLEISPHSASGKVYWSKRFRFTGALGILLDFKKAQKLLDVPDYPSDRGWLISVRNESWQSDKSAWWAMEREGVGLVFDHTADSIKNRSLYLAPHIWFEGGEQQRLFVPIFERSVSTPVDNFRLQGSSVQNIASLPSAQAEPCCIPLSYPEYSRYVERWHTLFGRLSTVGGLTEVWLWHPGGVALKNGFSDMLSTLQRMKTEPNVSILRGDVVASWRYNRELHRIQTKRNRHQEISTIKLMPATAQLKPLPPDAPALAASTSYWVLGSLDVPGWNTRQWTDPMGRTVTVLVHPLGN